MRTFSIRQKKNLVLSLSKEEVSALTVGNASFRPYCQGEEAGIHEHRIVTGLPTVFMGARLRGDDEKAGLRGDEEKGGFDAW